MMAKNSFPTGITLLFFRIKICNIRADRYTASKVNSKNRIPAEAFIR